jgi:hypothetical protein
MSNVVAATDKLPEGFCCCLKEGVFVILLDSHNGLRSGLVAIIIIIRGKNKDQDDR